MDSLRKDLILFRTAEPSSDVFKLRFGDWLSIKHLLQSAAASFDNDSNEARRLLELSVCADSNATARFNLNGISHLTEQVFDTVQNEFFPDLPPASDELFWNTFFGNNAANLQHQDPNNAGEWHQSPTM